MEVRAIFGVSVLLSAILGLGDVGPSDQELLTAAADLVDIHSTSAKSFELDASFSAQVNVPQDGHLTWKWVAKDLWSQEITMAGFRQLSVRKGDNLHISRNAPFTPLRITQLQDLLKVLSVDVDEWQIKKIKHQVQSGIETACLEVRARSSGHSGNSKRELCINQTTKELLTDEVRDDQEYRRKEFSDYQPFGGHGYPRHLGLFVDGSQALSVRITSLRENEFEATVFVPPAEAVVRRQCEHMIHAVALKTPDPAYPRSASQNRIGGTTIVALTVLPDGSVNNVQLIGSAGKEMDQVTQEIVKTWKFKPAMCGNEPVASDIRVDMNFRLR